MVGRRAALTLKINVPHYDEKWLAIEQAQELATQPVRYQY